MCSSDLAKVCVVDEKKFLDTMRCEDVCFAIVSKNGKTKVEEMPAKVAELLKEFPDIVLDNVPNGLPPVRKISHQMDLILGASFANKAAHRMTPAIVERVDLRESESMCCTNSINTKEEWRMEDVHRFLHYQQNHHQL